MSQGWLTGTDGWRFYCCLMFRAVCFWNCVFPLRCFFKRPPPTLSRVQSIWTTPTTGVDKGMHLLSTELFNLWLIIIWLHKRRDWENSSAGVQLIVLFRPLLSDVGAELTGVLDACTSDTGPYCWSYCITRTSLMWKDCRLKWNPETFNISTYYLFFFLTQYISTSEGNSLSFIKWNNSTSPHKHVSIKSV